MRLFIFLPRLLGVLFTLILGSSGAADTYQPKIERGPGESDLAIGPGMDGRGVSLWDTEIVLLLEAVRSSPDCSAWLSLTPPVRLRARAPFH